MQCPIQAVSSPTLAPTSLQNFSAPLLSRESLGSSQASYMEVQEGIFGLPKLPLVGRPTPIHRLEGLQSLWRHPDIFVKREDLTAQGYGGNKVRNLQYILADARRNGAKKLLTVAPLGSNFIAALAVHAKRAHLAVEVHHFVPHRNSQIDAHLNHSLHHGAEISVHKEGWSTKIAAFVAGVAALKSARRMEKRPYWVAPGGSNVLGTAGHVEAVFELAHAIKLGLVPEPDVIVVGAGTCGTMAGLQAGLMLTGLQTKLIGIRCVDELVCNRANISRLANSVLSLSEKPYLRVKRQDIDLRPPPLGDLGYAKAHSALSTIQEDVEEDGILLDSTYTSKVVLSLRALIKGGELAGKRVLYWHSFSAEKLAF